MALIPLTAGHLEVDGEDVWAHARSWRALMGYVPQSVYLMDDTLRRNVAFGEPDSAIDEGRLRHALHLAQLDSFLERQPKGLDTILGEGGSGISGGERQRVGIARALYHDPHVLVLDEVTSQLDVETEHALSQALAGLKGDKTVIVIAHRLSTVRNCDRVVFLKDGRIQDAAPFEVLAQRNADFERMVALASLGVLREQV